MSLRDTHCSGLRYYVRVGDLRNLTARAEVMAADSEEVLEHLEGVIYYVDPNSVGTLSFVGGKERVHIPLKKQHFNLDAFKKHIVDHAGLKSEAEKRGLGSSIELKLCRLSKSVEGTKAFSINTQSQWETG